ncbi:MAG: alpha/beta hydrolase [Acidimicrobiia bacterium]
MSGVGPFDVPGLTAGMGPARYMFRLARRAPWLARRFMAPMGSALENDPDRAMERVMTSLATPDQEMMRSRPELRQAFVASLREAYRQGVAGIVDDMALHARPWGFDIAGIRVPVHVWHGEADRNVPPAMGRYLAAAIPGAQRHFLAGGGTSCSWTTCPRSSPPCSSEPQDGRISNTRPSWEP